jgi:hypothetical protein
MSERKPYHVQKSVTKFNANIAAEFKTVFGPPLVHKTADENIYNAILYRLAKTSGHEILSNRSSCVT